MVFVGGRQILDAILIAVEATNDYIFRQKKGFIIKVTLRKPMTRWTGTTSTISCSSKDLGSNGGRGLGVVELTLTFPYD